MAENNTQNQSNASANKSFGGDQVTQGRQGSTAFLALNGVEVVEGNFVAQARVPSEDSIDVAIRRRDAEDSPVVHIRLDIVSGKGTKFRVRSAVFLADKNGTTEVESLDRPDAEELLRYVRVLLHTNRQGLPSNGRIASLIDEAITQAKSEARGGLGSTGLELARSFINRHLRSLGLGRIRLGSSLTRLGLSTLVMRSLRRLGFWRRSPRDCLSLTG